MDTFRDLVNLWPSTKDFASDIGATALVVRQMRNRDSIPAEYWESIIAGANARDIAGVTLENLARLAARRRRSEAA